MNQQLQAFIEEAKPDFSEKNQDNIWITKSYVLRRWIGILGMLLPILLWFFLFIDTKMKMKNTLESISHYYFTRVGSVFVLILGVLAIFLIIYKGKQWVDFILSTLAGLAALCVILFPTSNITELCKDTDKYYAVMILPYSEGRAYFHYGAAGVFLTCLAFMCLCVFTKSDQAPKDRGKKKILRNRIYRVCAAVMFLAMLAIFAGFMEVINPNWYQSHCMTFWMETVAVEFFGFAWLVKGETLFRD